MYSDNHPMIIMMVTPCPSWQLQPQLCTAATQWVLSLNESCQGPVIWSSGQTRTQWLGARYWLNNKSKLQCSKFIMTWAWLPTLWPDPILCRMTQTMKCALRVNHCIQTRYILNREYVSTCLWLFLICIWCSKASNPKFWAILAFRGLPLELVWISSNQPFRSLQQKLD